MKKTRRNHSAAFKARNAKEALRGIKPINQIAEENNLHPVQVSTWKKELEENMTQRFERKNAADHKQRELEKHCERLERKLDRTVVEKAFLLKKCEELGIDP